MKSTKTKQELQVANRELLLENRELKATINSIAGDCYIMGTYGEKNRLTKKEIIARALHIYRKNLNGEFQYFQRL